MNSKLEKREIFKFLTDFRSLQHQFTFRGMGLMIKKKYPSNTAEMIKLSQPAKRRIFTE